MDDLSALEAWAAPLLRRLEPGERRRLARTVGAALRRSQTQRIARQQNPDGSGYAPRKQQLRSKTGRIRKLKMFVKLRQARYFKIIATEQAVSVGFTGRVSRIARVHQEGMMDAVRPGGPRARYEQRVLLGFTPADRELVQQLLMEHLTR
ncbi:phage virion morphogenesis protein [Xanthomonas translucens]|uniref:phage virion morphogenesis protein n=1 Tax=Xanthomonas campestris pv. translucens TaxID=343 RepID=UPI0019D589D1|nr:phage virion morphogenesis protein [Xanthomonas translucens]QSQ38930.1 phage virion morphogenesis protein [Xanthomonas translucens pv. translucens]